MKIRKLNWMQDPHFENEYTVKIRYRHGGALAKLTPNEDGTFWVDFRESQRAISPVKQPLFIKTTWSLAVVGSLESTRGLDL